MVKPFSPVAPPVKEAPPVEAKVVVVRKVANEKYDVSVVVLRSVPVEETKLETRVSLPVAREAANNAMRKYMQTQLDPIGGHIDA